MPPRPVLGRENQSVGGAHPTSLLVSEPRARSHGPHGGQKVSPGLRPVL